LISLRLEKNILESLEFGVFFDWLKNNIYREDSFYILHIIIENECNWLNNIFR